MLTSGVAQGLYHFELETLKMKISVQKKWITIFEFFVFLDGQVLVRLDQNLEKLVTDHKSAHGVYSMSVVSEKTFSNF